jgi:hypothetical protein
VLRHGDTPFPFDGSLNGSVNGSVRFGGLLRSL